MVFKPVFPNRENFKEKEVISVSLREQEANAD